MTVAGDLLEGLCIQLVNKKAGVGSFKRKEGGKEGDGAGRKWAAQRLYYGEQLRAADTDNSLQN